MKLPEGLSQEVIDAINVFTPEELSCIRAIYLDTTGEFIGVRMIDSEIAYKPADIEKQEALLVIENAYRKELYAL